jgi:hypothetical protein
MPTSSPTTLDDPATGPADRVGRLRLDQAEVPIRSRRERELARLLLAKARWKRHVDTPRSSPVRAGSSRPRVTPEATEGP